MGDNDIKTGSVDLDVAPVPAGTAAAPDQDEQERQKRLKSMQTGPVQIGQPGQAPVSTPQQSGQPFKWNFTTEDGKTAPAPSLSSMSFADAITKQEGAKPELNNPGNIKDPRTNTIKKFDTLDEGRDALNAQLLSMASGNSPHYPQGVTLREAGKTYSDGDPNWSTNVARMMGVSEDTPVSQIFHTGAVAEKQATGEAAPYQWKFTRNEPLDLKNEAQMFDVTTHGGAIGKSAVPIEELSNGVGAALGDVWHGVVDSRINGKAVTQHFIDMGYEIDALLHNKPLRESEIPTMKQLWENVPDLGTLRLPSLESVGGEIAVQTKDGIKRVPTGIPLLGMMYSMLRENDPDGNHYDAKTMLLDYMERGGEAVSMVTSPAFFGSEAIRPVVAGFEVLKATETTAKTLDYMQTVSKSSELMREGVLLELTDASKQVEAAKVTFDQVIAARDVGSATQEQVIAARNAYLELVGKVNQSTASFQKAEEAVNIAKARVENTQAILGRLQQETKSLSNQFVAALPKSVVQGAMYAQKPLGYGFAINAIPGVLTPQQDGESYPDYLGRVLMSGGMVATGAGELAGDAKTMGDYFGGAKTAFEAMGSIFKRSTTDEAWQKSKSQNEAQKAFVKAIPPGRGNADYDPKTDYWAMRPFMENEHAQEDIAHPGRVGDAMEHVRQGIENQVRAQVDKYTNEELRLGVNADGTKQTLRQKIAARLLPNERVTPGFTDDALKAVEKYNIDNPSVGEADALRRQINNLVRDKMAKNGWDRARLMAVDPEFAGLMALNEALRDGVYGTLGAVGVKGAEDMRQLEVSASKIRDAAYKQNNNAEVARRGTGEQSKVKKIAANIAGRGIGAIVGGGAGSLVGPAGTIVGGVLGEEIGGRVQEAIAKPNQTVEQLLKTSFAATGAPDNNVAIDATGAKTPANAPPEHPRENSDLHAKLRQYFVGDPSLRDKPYRNLETAFTTKYEREVGRGLKPDADEKSLYLEIQKAKNEDIVAAKEAAVKATEDAAKVKDAQEKAEEQAIKVEIQKVEEEEQAKAQKKAEKAQKKAEKEATGEAIPAENVPGLLDIARGVDKEKIHKEGQAIAEEDGREEGRSLQGRALLANIKARVAKGEVKPTLSAVGTETEPHPTLLRPGPNGEDTERALHHEYGHDEIADRRGIETTRIYGEDKVSAASIGYVSKPLALRMQDAPGTIKATPEEIAQDTRNWIDANLGGVITQELLHEIPFKENEGRHGDYDNIKRYIEAAKKLGAPMGDMDAEIANAYDRVKKDLTEPGVLDKIVANASVREKGTPTDLHATNGRLVAIRGERANARQTETGSTGGGASSLRSGAGGPGEQGTVQEGGRGGGAPPPGAGQANETSPVGRNRGVNHKDVLEAIKEKHGVTDDTAGIREGGQSFITPEGQFVHLPAGTTHTDAITENGGPASGPENGHDNRPAFINDTGAVRVHLANERAGKTLAASVPAQGVQNAEQVGAIQRLVGQELPRTGNLRMERADVNAENAKTATAEKAFPRVSDVPKMLKKIGALPPDVEKSLMTYDAMKGLKEANEDQERAGRVNAAPPTPVPELDRAVIPGGQHSTPAPTYHEAAQSKGNPWVRRSADPAKSAAPTNEGRQLMIQISSDLINGTKGEVDQATQYYDKLYSGARPGYARMQDFWEIPQWQGFVSHVLPDADVYVVRDMDQAKNFLKAAKYDRVLASALDVNTSFLKDLAKSVPEQTFDVGGYVEPGTFLEHPNVKYHSSVENMTKDPYYVEKGIQYKNGTDYRHYEGSDVIPRLTMSDGCLHKCAFCVVPKELKITPNAVVDQQAQSMGKLGAKLVYLNDKTFGQAPNYQHLADVYTKMKEANPDFQGFVVQTTAAQMRKMPADWLQKSGIKYVELGIESYNDPILKEMHKPATEKLIDEATDKLRENNIALIPNILIGLPGENANTYAHTLEFLKRNKDIISHANIYNLAVYKDAELGKKLTTANEGDFNENVLEKSFHTDPEVHRVFAGDLYGVGQELLSNTPKPLETAERSQLSVRNGAKNINDMDENDLMFQTGKARNAIFQRAEESAKGGGFTIHSDTGHVPTEGHVIEVHPESREDLPSNITAADVSKFYDKVRPLLDQHPELHLGGYGKQLSLSAVGTPEGAKKVGNDLDQQTAWDARNQQTVPLEGKGIKTQFPDYSLDQRLKDLGARTPEGKPTGQGIPPERSELGHGLVRHTTGDEAKDKIIEDAGGVPGGIQRGIPGKLSDQAYIHDPITGTSLNLPLDQITPEGVSSYLLESRKKYAETPEGRAKYGLNEDGTVNPERSQLAKKTGSNEEDRRAGLGGVVSDRPEGSGFAYSALKGDSISGMGDMGRGGKSWLAPNGTFSPVDIAHYQHIPGYKAGSYDSELEPYMEKGNIRIGGLDVAGSPVLIHAYKSVPTEAQRAAISKAVTDQGGAIYDLIYGDRHESGEAKSANDLSKAMQDVYGKALGEAKSDHSKTHPHLPDSVRNDMDPDELAFSADKPNLQKNIFKELNKIEPTVNEIANAAKAGHVLGGWWQRYMDTFKAMGEPNEAAEMEQVGPSHTEALKAFHGALSGNKPVEAANKLAWNAYHDWLEAGRPRDRAAINQIIAQNGSPKGVTAISDTHKGGKVVHEGLDTTKLFKLANSPQMRDENPEPFTGNAFLDSPVYGSTPGAKKIPSMVATTAGEGNLNRVVFDTHMKDLYRQNGLTDAKYIADSIHMRRAARELGLQAGEGQEQVWGTVLGLKQLLGEGMTSEEAAAGLNDPVIHQIGKDYAAVILEAIETDPEFRSTLDGLHKYGFSPTSEQALAKLREIVKSGEARIGTGPAVNRELLGKTAEGLARHIGVDVDAIRRERAEAPTFNFGYNAVQEATNKGALDRLSKP